MYGPRSLLVRRRYLTPKVDDCAPATPHHQHQHRATNNEKTSGKILDGWNFSSLLSFVAFWRCSSFSLFLFFFSPMSRTVKVTALIFPQTQSRSQPKLADYERGRHVWVVCVCECVSGFQSNLLPPPSNASCAPAARFNSRFSCVTR